MAKLRELEFHVKKAIRKNAYGVFIDEFHNVNSLPINEYRDFYDTEYGILYIHDGEGPLDLILALKPLLCIKQALLFPSFANELDKALIGEPYEPKFRNAVREFLTLQDANFENKKIYHKEFGYLINKLVATIKPCVVTRMPPRDKIIKY